MYEYEHIMTFDEPMAMGSSTSTSNNTTVRKKKSIKSDNALDLRGPMEVDGSVKSMESVTFSGDFAVRDRIEAYGNLEVHGNLNCGGKVKSMGNVKVVGGVVCMDKVKIFGKLKIKGTLEVHGDLEVWGALTINGYLKCRTLTAYASLTTVGDQSWYEVEEGETVHGAKLIQRNYVG
ncbi:hypothetical protein C8A00DRAFT_39680 [Chaetomidium leptoderma]|uniref:Polymer-forming cytoskeletal protein n=1 Tax=Chaetomidium leptoderma TaxID=669021 RepID=A0AAN6VV89_9PEZI|nr:hypothetical protein C8A00DRAFT_39680 [Chaetomidium leptoderma]